MPIYTLKKVCLPYKSFTNKQKKTLFLGKYVKKIYLCDNNSLNIKR